MISLAQRARQTTSVLLILSFFSLLVVTHSTIFPFVVGKIFFFRTIIELALFFFLFSPIFDNSNDVISFFRQSLKNPLVAAVTFFMATVTFTAFLGYDVAQSFWSNYVRGEGVFQIWHYYVFFLLLLFSFRDSRSWKIIFWFIILVNLATIVFGLPAYLESIKIDNRFKGTIGNPAFTAVSLLFTLWFLFYLLIVKNGNERKSPFFLKIIYLAGIVFFLSILFLTGTRGALLGLIGGSLIGLIYFLIIHAPIRIRLSGLGGLFFLSIILGVLFYWQPLRIFQISLLEQTAQTRFWTWGSALKGWREKPIFGWGSENFSEVFNRYFDQRHYQGPAISSETWFDRTHNIFLEYLNAGGLFGLFGYLGLWAGFYYLLFRSRLKPLPQTLFFVFPIIYLIQGSLLFETLPAYLNLFLFLAFAAYSFQKSEELTIPKKPNPPSLHLFFKIISSFLILTIAGGWYFGNYLPFKKAFLFNQALAEVASLQSFAEFESSFSKSLAIKSPYGQDELLKMLGGLTIDLLSQNPSPEVAKALADYLDRWYQPILKRGKGNNFSQNYYVLGRVHDLAGNQPAAQYYFTEGLKLWPARPDFKDALETLLKKGKI